MKIGVIGLGSIGRRHAINLSKMGHQVIGYDPATIVAKALGPLPNFEVAETVDELFAKSDAVVIASPTSKHEKHLWAAAEEGKHILVEKPIGASNLQNVRDSLATAKQKNLVVMTAYNLHFHACVKQARQWLSGGKIGNPIWASVTLAQYSEKEPYLRDGVILNWSHEIDLALYLLGPATVEGARIRQAQFHKTNEPPRTMSEHSAEIWLKHDSVLTSAIRLDYVTRPEIRATTIIGDKGQIAIDLVNNTACFVDLEGKREDLQLQQTWDQTYVEEMQAFLDRIEGKETLGATGEEGLAVLEICLEARRLAGITP